MSRLRGRPGLRRRYNYVLADAAGVAGANRFLALFNPANSGRVIRVTKVACQAYAAAGTNALASMGMFQITAASGGTLASGSAINRDWAEETDSLAQVRVDNPTVTAGSVPLAAFAPAIVVGLTIAGVAAASPPSVWNGALHLAAGTGVVLQTAPGDTDQRWNIGIDWTEFTG